MNRNAAYSIEPHILNRWSPRAMSGEPLLQETVYSLLEAARWAPSAMNFQPWRFLYALRDTPEWDVFFDLLVEGNRVWAQHAAALFVVLSQNTNPEDGKPFKTHSFDCGAAWENLALQGSAMGLVVHGMAGFDYAAAQKALNTPDTFTVQAMIAVGKPGNPEDLPEHLRSRETPSDRKPVQSISAPGKFPEAWNT